MYRISILLVVAVSCGVTTAILVAQQGPEKRASQEHSQTLPAPTGRTLDDVRQAYTPLRLKGARALSAAESPPPVPRPPRIVEAEVFA